MYGILSYVYLLGRKIAALGTQNQMPSMARELVDEHKKTPGLGEHYQA